MKTELTAISVVAVLTAVHPQAMIGASFGCLFFLSTQSNCSVRKSLVLGVLSLGAGYSVGIAVDTAHSMWVSLTGASLGSVVLSGLHGAIKNGGDLPPWAKTFIDSILRLKK